MSESENELAHEYDIPDVSTARVRVPLALGGVGLILAAGVIRHVIYIEKWTQYRTITIVWAVTFAILATQWVVSWMERPYTVSDEDQQYLDALRVTVNVPVYNEEPVVLDRVLFALFRQTRLPDRVDVVDDGSTKADYAAVREYWLRHHPPEVELRWRAFENAGKKRAQARTFSSDPDADIFITVDSDTTLARNAIDEGLKPFVDSRVHSVGGIELAWNYSRSLLTRIKGVNALVWQFTVCSAQNVAGGQLLVNRGTYALYRADMIRETLDAYLGETLWGHRIMLGDDTMLTLFALNRGRAVQQPSAMCFAMYPETLSHTMRQWTRWMRGTALRTLWRLRYLPPTSWSWWYTLLTTWSYIAFVALIVAVLSDWHAASTFAETFLYISAVWMWLVASRIFAVKRSDQRSLDRAEAFALVPVAWLWLTLVLRPVRLYGTVTMLRQGWVTRQRAETLSGAGKLERSVRAEG